MSLETYTAKYVQAEELMQFVFGDRVFDWSDALDDVSFGDASVTLIPAKKFADAIIDHMNDWELPEGGYCAPAEDPRSEIPKLRETALRLSGRDVYINVERAKSSIESGTDVEPETPSEQTAPPS